MISHIGRGKASRKVPAEKGCVLCFLLWSPCTFGITHLCFKECSLVSSEREDSVSFQSLLMRHYHIQEYMMLMDEDGLTSKAKRFPGLICA